MKTILLTICQDRQMRTDAVSGKVKCADGCAGQIAELSNRTGKIP